MFAFQGFYLFSKEYNLPTSLLKVNTYRTMKNNTFQCENGVWTAVTGVAVDPAYTVETPDKDTKCECAPFKLWYNPNDERGAAFYCTETKDFSVATPADPVTLSKFSSFYLCITI